MEETDLYFARTLPDGRVIHVLPLLFGQARLGIGPANDRAYQDVW